jgi:short-subunit dehydrogenase
MRSMRSYQRALVTGASSGIGEHIARLLAGRGAGLVLVARRADRLAALAEELRTSHGTTVQVLPADLTDAAQLAAVEKRLADRTRPVDLLVNNAGFGTNGTFARMPVQEEEREIQLNVLALVRLTHAVLAGMLDSGFGGILNVSSLAGFMVSPSSATYAACKAFVTSFSESLHTEVKRAGVHVTALCPGFTRTEFTDVARIDARGVPRAMWLSAPQVAAAGLDAVSAGRAYAVPGLQYKVALPLFTKLVPRSWIRALAVRNFAP